MISVVEQSILPVPPERVWQFFEEIETHYPNWHREHLRWRWLQGHPLAQGSIWHADEWIGPLRLSCRFFITDSNPGRMFAYRVGHPHALLRAGGSFQLHPAPNSRCKLIQETHIGYRRPVIAVATDPILNAALPVADLRRHIREEHTNLRMLLSPA